MQNIGLYILIYNRLKSLGIGKCALRAVCGANKFRQSSNIKD
jgi:hypothetical protein